jgi:haloacetate dehalogenase
MCGVLRQGKMPVRRMGDPYWMEGWLAMFEGFARRRVDVGGIGITTLTGGSGPPLLLLHGYPQTSAIWHRVASRLASRYTVVATDLRGYGDSSKPPGLPDHSNYSKREMAADQAGVMRVLGFDKYFLAGHDRGGRVAHRLAVDHHEHVRKLLVLDISPTLAMYEQTDMDFARAYWHWFFLIQPAPIPEDMINADRERYLRAKMFGRSAAHEPFAPEAWAEYVRCFDAAAVHGSCEDYRAAAGIDLEHDRADIASGTRVRCPMRVLWGAKGVVERCFRPLDDWAKVATEVSGRSLPGGHYLPEEVPELVTDEFGQFFQ